MSLVSIIDVGCCIITKNIVEIDGQKCNSPLLVAQAPYLEICVDESILRLCGSDCACAFEFVARVDLRAILSTILLILDFVDSIVLFFLSQLQRFNISF